MASEQKSTYHHGDLRQALLKSARSLLERDGPQGLGLRAITRDVGVMPASAYHHFAGRDDIAAALAEEGFHTLATRLRQAARDAGGKLLPVGEAYVAFAVEEPALYRLMFGETFQVGTPAAQKVSAARQNLGTILSTGIAGRYPDADVADSMLFLWSLVHGLAMLSIDIPLAQETQRERVRNVLVKAGKAFEPG